MLTYTTLQDRPREFLAATGLTHTEFAHLLPAFAAAYALLYPPEKTLEGKLRQRRAGGGTTGTLPQMEDGSVSKVEMAMFTLPVRRHSG